MEMLNVFVKNAIHAVMRNSNMIAKNAKENDFLNAKS
jgi:hypothetical protein